MSADQQARGYTPRAGDRVTVRRYIVTGGKRKFEAAHSGLITETYSAADGHYLCLDSYPDRIFTGDQFLGAGEDGRSPATLVTEVLPGEPCSGCTAQCTLYPACVSQRTPDPEPDQWRHRLTPDLFVVLDAGDCIVLEVTDAKGRVLRRPTVTDVDEFKRSLDNARIMQQAAGRRAAQRRLEGMDEARRLRGELDRKAGVEFLMRMGLTRNHAANVLVRAYQRLPDWREPARTPMGEFAVSYDDAGGYWRITMPSHEGCAVCGGRGVVLVPDEGGESASEQACPEQAEG